MKNATCLAGSLAAACAGLTLAAQEASAPRELGAVRWQRAFEPALASAKAAGKPVMLLFQEVPG